MHLKYTILKLSTGNRPYALLFVLIRGKTNFVILLLIHRTLLLRSQYDILRYIHVPREVNYQWHCIPQTSAVSS